MIGKMISFTKEIVSAFYSTASSVVNSSMEAWMKRKVIAPNAVTVTSGSGFSFSF
jgi:hypothetical protein